MGGSNRSTQDGQHAARTDARGAHLPYEPAAVDAVVDALSAPSADPVRQFRGKALVATLAWAPCSGPAGLARSWPCAHPDGFGHEGDHERFSRPDVEQAAVITQVRDLRTERDELRACLLIARPLLMVVRNGVVPASLVARIDKALR